MTFSILFVVVGAGLMVASAWMVSVVAGVGLLGLFLLAVGLFAEFGDET